MKTKILLFSVILIFFGCSTGNSDLIDQKTEWLRILPLELNFAANGGEREVRMYVTNDVDINQVTYTVNTSGEDWVQLSKNGELLKITVEPTFHQVSRATVITLSYGNYIREVPVIQQASEGAVDIQIKVASAWATSEETVSEPRGIEKSYDGDFSTYFNSLFGAITSWPFIVEYTLEPAERLNYIVYYPRPDGFNAWGQFNRYSIYVSTVQAPETFVKIGDYERGNANFSPHRINLETPIENPYKVRFEIHSANNNRVSIVQMEFYQSSLNRFDYTTIFTDFTCSELRPGIMEADIRRIPDADYRRLATALLNNTYNKAFRVAEYRPYQDPSIMANINKTEHYSLRDNPTGIYVNANEEFLVFVGNTRGQNISMVVQDLMNGYGSSRTFPLFEGENRIRTTTGGLIYILNITNDDIPLILETEADKARAAEKSVKVHFAFGKVNGYFDSQKHTLADWREMLRTAPYREIDVVGVRSHITWAVADFREADSDIVSIVEKFDRLVYLQQEFLGLEKYNKMFRNRMYFHIYYNPPPGVAAIAARNRTAYGPGITEAFTRADRFEARIWGPAHEVGHINQTRPGLRWRDKTEVTVNIYSMYSQQQFGQPSRLLQSDGYAAGWARIVDTGVPFGSNAIANQFFPKLVPFWQLHLYLTDALGQADFYRDLHEHYRITPTLSNAGVTDGVYQLDFVRQVCRVSGFNLENFFRSWGFLTPIDEPNMVITQAQINALLSEIRQYPQPPHQDIHLITETNLDSYR
ncbi:MAG: M60 family metallopeptidase [Dysgonamonadaceae bacterium]|jgi:hypothetical protein|nr:M60 family metallopeptidase [Dysgonamonadaceae bacterium]